MNSNGIYQVNICLYCVKISLKYKKIISSKIHFIWNNHEMTTNAIYLSRVYDIFNFNKIMIYISYIYNVFRRLNFTQNPIHESGFEHFTFWRSD